MVDADLLPYELKALARRQAYELTDKHWAKDKTKLFDSIEKILNGRPKGVVESPHFTRQSRGKLIALLGLLIVILMAGIWSYIKVSNSLVVTNHELLAKTSGDSNDELLSLINNRMLSTGGCAGQHTDPSTDSWTAAQCLLGLLLGKDTHPDFESIKRSFDYLQRMRGERGWGARHSGKPATEVTAWVGLAYIMSITQGNVWSVDEKAKILNDLMAIYKEVIVRQSEQGGWASFQTSYIKPSAFAPYATDMALIFLLHLKRANILLPVNDELDRRIRKGLNWILEEYVSGLAGWEEKRDEGLQVDLTTLHLVVLSMAKRYGFSSVEADKRYRHAREEWIQRTSKLSTERTVSEFSRIRQMQDIFDINGIYVDSIEHSVALTWYPWTMLLANYLRDDQDLNKRDQLLSPEIFTALWSKLPSFVERVRSGPTYRAAEALFVLGMIEKSI